MIDWQKERPRRWLNRQRAVDVEQEVVHELQALREENGVDTASIAGSEFWYRLDRLD
jgi:hypothetical protein